MRRWLHRMGIMGSLLLLGGCASTRFVLTNGAVVEGCIRCADAASIDVVEGRSPGECSGYHRVVRLHRAQVREIQHPGNLQAVFGTMMVAAGGALLPTGVWLGTTTCGPVNDCSLTLVTLVGAALGILGGGVPLMVLGFRTGGISREAAEPNGVVCPWTPGPGAAPAMEGRTGSSPRPAKPALVDAP